MLDAADDGLPLENLQGGPHRQLKADIPKNIGVDEGHAQNGQPQAVQTRRIASLIIYCGTMNVRSHLSVHIIAGGFFYT